jgi:Tripartite tricarboxylate transporter TctB family
MKLLRHPDVLAALILGALGASFFVASLGHEFGRSVDMGPGYFPRIVGGALVLLALLIGLRGLIEASRSEDNGRTALGFPLGPILTVGVALALFSLTLRSLGYVIAAVLLVAVAGAASPQRRWREVALLAVALSLASGGLFVLALKLQAPLWPAL